jgi:hypothetical protein
VRTPEMQGLSAAVLRNGINDLSGIGIAGYNHIRGTQRGLVIGVYNRAETLHGVQLGLINYAGNNSGLLRVLPLINIHK